MSALARLPHRWFLLCLPSQPFPLFRPFLLELAPRQVAASAPARDTRSQ
jgi:hypothetical protein